MPLVLAITTTSLLSFGATACGDGEALGPAAPGAGRLEQVGDAPEATLRARMAKLVDGDPTLEDMAALWSDRCRDSMGLDELRGADRKSAEAALRADAESATLVDITSRPRPDGAAEAEILIENAYGELEGALQWMSVVAEDGEWRLDDCDARARFRRVGESLEASPRTPPITASDEDAVARLVEARYLGTGPAQAVWDAISTRCRDVEWDGSFEEFRAQHEAVGDAMADDPVSFVVDEVSIVSTMDDAAQVNLVATRDGHTIDTAATGYGFDYLYEDGRWREDDCTEPTDDDSGSPGARFEEVGEAITE